MWTHTHKYSRADVGAFRAEPQHGMAAQPSPIQASNDARPGTKADRSAQARAKRCLQHTLGRPAALQQQLLQLLHKESGECARGGARHTS